MSLLLKRGSFLKTIGAEVEDVFGVGKENTCKLPKLELGSMIKDV